MTAPNPETTVWTPCSACRGSGMQDYGDRIGSCYYCEGDGVVRVRDERGRFARSIDGSERAS